MVGFLVSAPINALVERDFGHFFGARERSHPGGFPYV